MEPNIPGGAGSPFAWLQHARSDFALAEAPPAQGVLLEALCFHLQQAVEKAMKAVLLFETGETPPRSHDLVLLLDLVNQSSIPIPPPLERTAAQRLTIYAVLARYPSDFAEIDEAEWRDAVDAAHRVVVWAEQVIGGGAL